MHPPQDLVELSNRLGDPSRKLAILAEGNTSCVDGEHIWVKASGTQLAGIDATGFVKCDPQALIQALDLDLDDSSVFATLEASTGANRRRPSVESFMHAWLLSLPGVRFVAHVHPVTVLALVCQPGAEQLCGARFFPDETVCCGPATAWVPYVDPGLHLAVAIRDSVSSFVESHGQPPKVVWMENHGSIGLGNSAAEAESAVLMNEKAASVVCLAGGVEAFLSGRIAPLSQTHVERIHTRPDEHYRQGQLWGK